ncbi:MAG: CDP-diacylglycerol--glycerol-3-phosphate 3-phosphatidyltransferase [Chrysiogenetes bacterium]|nr:CDP-diacylglycerol--glycerol-3-phosphate 3-phosphatidyltransferase [Chrysiogenetes bacterium]
MSKSKKRLWNPANIITMSRLALVPLVAVLLYPWGWNGEVPGGYQTFAAGMVFLAGMALDLVDGYLARANDYETAFGKLMDPLADKVLVLVALILLVEIHWVPGWVVALMITRELMVTSLRAVAAESQVVIQASSLGKYKTAYQTAALTGCLIHYHPSEIFGVALHPLIDWNFGGVGLVLLYMAAVVTVWSGIDYFVKFWRHVIGGAAA